MADATLPIPSYPRIDVGKAQLATPSDITAGLVLVGYLNGAPKRVQPNLVGSAAPVSSTSVTSLLRNPVGIISDTVVNSSTSLGFDCTIDGDNLPHVVRSDLAKSGAAVLNSTGRMTALFCTGASAVNSAPNPAGDLANRTARLALAVSGSELAIELQGHINLINGYLAADESRRVFKPCDANGNALPQNQTPQSGAVDIVGCTGNTGFSPLPMGMLIAYQRFLAREGMQVEPIFLVCCAGAGFSIAQLLPGGSTSFAAGQGQIALGKALATVYGLPGGLYFSMPTYFIADCGVATAVGAYTPQLQQMQAAITAANFNGDGSVIPFALDQSPPDTTHNISFPAAIDQLNYPLANSNSFNLGPRYFASMLDNHHPDTVGQIMINEMHAWEYILWLSGKWIQPVRRAAHYFVNNGDGTCGLTVDFTECVLGAIIPLSINPNIAITGQDTQLGMRILRADGVTYLPINNVRLLAGTSRVTGTIQGIPSVGDSWSNALHGNFGVTGSNAGVFSNLCKKLTKSTYDPTQNVYTWCAQESSIIAGTDFIAPPALPMVNSISLGQPGSIQSGQNATQIIGMLTAATSGAVGAITWSVAPNQYVSIVNGNQLQASSNVANDGSLSISITATPTSGAPLTSILTIPVS